MASKTARQKGERDAIIVQLRADLAAERVAREKAERERDTERGHCEDAGDVLYRAYTRRRRAVRWAWRFRQMERGAAAWRSGAMQAEARANRYEDRIAALAAHVRQLEADLAVERAAREAAEQEAARWAGDSAALREEKLIELALHAEEAAALRQRMAALEGALNISRDDVGRIMHESWSRTKLAQGFHGPGEACTRWDRCPAGGQHCGYFHADLIPWDDLPERQQDINLHSFDDVFAEMRRRAALAAPPQPAGEQ